MASNTFHSGSQHHTLQVGWRRPQPSWAPGTISCLATARWLLGLDQRVAAIRSIFWQLRGRHATLECSGEKGQWAQENTKKRQVCRKQGRCIGRPFASRKLLEFWQRFSLQTFRSWSSSKPCNNVTMDHHLERIFLSSLRRQLLLKLFLPTKGGSQIPRSATVKHKLAILK